MLSERPTSNVQLPTSNAEAIQAELPLAEKERRDREQLFLDVAEFEGMLATFGRLTARQICAHRAGWDDRYVRKLAERSAGVLSFPGSQGYSLIAAAGDDELRHAANAIATQVAVMQAKRVRFENILGLRHAAQKLGDAHAASDAVARELSAEYFAEGAQ
jgi:hypothetical protein